MNNFLEIRTLDDLKEFIFLNKESIKRAALPVTVAVALLFFWIAGGDSTENIEITEEGTQIAEETQETSEKSLNSGVIYVDISGCVNNPGVYEFKSGARVFHVIEEAGGLTEDANIDDLNRAEEIVDGQKIVIYSKNSDEKSSYEETSSGKISINRADSAKLQEIPGVGPATAQKIIEYREQFGRFNKIEDIKNVSGIGDKTFESMKEYITV